jgi:hypothetical protein
MSAMAFESTETPLGVATTFTSPRRLTDRHDTITGTIFSDTAGTLHVEQGYTDAGGTDRWDSDTTHAVVASTGLSFADVCIAPNWRVRFVQAGTQTIFRLYAKTRASGTDA